MSEAANEAYKYACQQTTDARLLNEALKIKIKELKAELKRYTDVVNLDTSRLKKQ